MFTIAICDDERQFRKRIHDILIEYMNENDILYEIDEFESGKDFMRYVKNTRDFSHGMN